LRCSFTERVNHSGIQKKTFVQSPSFTKGFHKRFKSQKGFVIFEITQFV